MRSNAEAFEPPGARAPTSHERVSGRSWDASYRDAGPAPWDIGRPQAPFVRIVSARGFADPVLDAGCGTGEHALLAASFGLRVLGVDLAATAVSLAQTKALERGLDAEFAVADAFELHRLGRTFRTVLDCGLFHTFDSFERPRYVASLASVAEPGATLYVLCFSDEAPDVAPHPISRTELRAAFDDHEGWKIVSVEPDRIDTTFTGDHGIPAWFATIRRT
jgi:SAM-dependent methyltransferase